MERVREASDLIPCSFPLQFYLFRAYEQVGMYDATEALWKLWEQPLEWHMTTLPEEPGVTRSDCHAWGSLMLYEFPRRILGVEAAEPGYESIRIRPLARYVKRASGKAYTPVGEVHVAYTSREEGFWIQVENHTGKSCVLFLPDGTQVNIGSGENCEAHCAR